MRFLPNLFRKKNTALKCRLQDIFDLMRQGVCTQAPILDLIVQIRQQEHRMGVSADMTRDGKFFDILYFFDEAEYSSLADLRSALPYNPQEEVTVLADAELGDPHTYTLLAEREIRD